MLLLDGQPQVYTGHQTHLRHTNKQALYSNKWRKYDLKRDILRVVDKISREGCKILTWTRKFIDLTILSNDEWKEIFDSSSLLKRYRNCFHQ